MAGDSTNVVFNDEHTIQAEFQVPASDVQAGVSGNVTLTANLTTVAPEFKDYVEGIRDEVEADRTEVAANLTTTDQLAYQADQSAKAANDSQVAAKSSEDAALLSAQAAKRSETASAASEQAAADSATAASTSESNAKASEQAAASSESNALSSEQAAKASETSAADSETAAKASETAAQSSETAARTSEQNAEASETAAATSESNALASETQAGVYKDDALAHRDKAQAWAENPHDVEVETGAYSAKHYAIDAGNSADEVLASEQAAKTSEINAGNSEDAAKASEVNASNSESAAAGSEAAAFSSETNAATSASEAAASATTAGDSADAAMASEAAAKTSEDNAAASESNALQSKNLASQYADAASTSETNAAASETAAAVSASQAATSESNAASSATSASSDASAAQTARQGAEAAEASTAQLLDQFGDMYLGPKAGDPTTDNDGNPLQVGASYLNTTENELRYYSGSVWLVPEDVATTAAANAEASAQAAATSESNAASSASTAGTAANTATSARDAAQTAASAAATSESNASDSEVNAAGSASTAQTAADTATVKANEASTSASNAATSETNAANSAAQAAEDAASVGASIDNALQPHLDAADPHPQYSLETEVNTALAGKVGTGDSRLTNAREWTASTVDQTEAEAGTSTTRRAWTAQRVKQAITKVVNALTKADVGLSNVRNVASYSQTESDANYLGKTAKAADSDKLDGLSSTDFIRNGYFEGKSLYVSGASYRRRVVLLFPRSTVNSVADRRVIGTLTLLKNGGNIFDSAEIYTQSAYNNTFASMQVTGQNPHNFRFVTVTHNGVPWLALEPNYRANPYNRALFTGFAYTDSGSADLLRIIDYYDTQNNIVLDEEINSSISHFQTTAPFYINEKLVWHAGNFDPASKAAASHTHDYLPFNGKAVDADKLDGLHASGFVRTPGSTAEFISGDSGNKVAANNTSINGIFYSDVTRFGAPDGALHNQAHSEKWQHQIYGDYRTGQISIRGKNSGTWQSWRDVWDSGNLPIKAPSGDIPLKLPANASFGKELWLGGWSGAAPSSAAIRTSNGNLHIDSASGYNTYIDYYQSATLRIGKEGNSNPVEINGNTVWHAGNFNPASKLDTGAKAADSDKLDGVHAGSFVRSDVANQQADFNKLFFEAGKHCINNNDGSGNFNIKVGVSADSNRLCTENGYGSHWTFNQGAGTWSFLTSTASATVGEGYNWNMPLRITPDGVEVTKITGDGSGLTGIGGVPAGIITMWSGSVASIPSGWALCDGNNGTPNLKDRFVVGAGGTYAVGTTGGSADAVVVAHSHAGSSDSAGNHNHSGSTSTTGSHTHTIGTRDPSFASSGYYDYGRTMVGDTRATARTDTTSSSGNHNHSLSIDSNGDHTHSLSIDSTGESGTNKNLPPYYALAYIMKL